MTNATISILEAFEELVDPRARECVHQLDELLLAAICAVISGAESWTSVVEWSEMKLEWLRQHLPFANGIASHDTFGRVLFSAADSGTLDRSFWDNIQVEKDHGRIETRRCLVTNDIDWLKEQN